MLSVATPPPSGRRKVSFRQASHAPDDPWHALDDRLPADDLARVIRAALLRLDWCGLFGLYSGRGSHAYPPDRLLAVVLYEIRHGHTSPAQWHRNARKVDSHLWLLGGLTPSRSCWYNFRDRIRPLLDSVNEQLLRLLDAEQLVPARRGTLDGTLIAANASRHRLVKQETLRRRIAALVAAGAAKNPAELSPAAAADKQPYGAGLRPATAAPAEPAAVATPPCATPPCATPPCATPPCATQATAGKGDTAGDATPAPTGKPGWMAKTTAGRQRQLRAHQRAWERMGQLQAENSRRKKGKRRPAEKLVVSLSDPEAALGWDKQHVYRPLYNVQLLNDVDSPFILGYRVVAQVNDAGLLGDMLQRQRQMLRRQVGVLLTDSGYTGGADLAAADEAKVTVYGPSQQNDYSKQKQAKGGQKRLGKSAFSYLATQDAYQCPEGKRLEKVGEQSQRRETSGKVRLRMYQAREEDCRGCQRREGCTSSVKKGRTVSRSEHEGLIEALKGRTQAEQGKELYKLRRQSGERHNADFKQHRKLRTFSGRGLGRASGEVALLVFANNLVAGEAERAKMAASLPYSNP